VIYPKPTGDLLRTPGRRPTPTLPVDGTSLLPYNFGTVKADTSRIGNLPGEVLLHVTAQSGVGRQLARPRSPGCAICVPLGCTGPVIQVTASRCGIASQRELNEPARVRPVNASFVVAASRLVGSVLHDHLPFPILGGV